MTDTTHFSDTETEGSEQLFEDETNDADVDYDGAGELDDEVELGPTAETAADGKPAKEAKPPKEKARGELPDNLVTPVGLAHVLTERGLGGKNEDGANKEVPPQVVYSYIKNAPAAHPYPGGTVQDSLGKDRDNVVDIEAGVAWWTAKNERAAARRANAAAKAQAALATKEKAAAKAAGTPTPVAEAEQEVATEAE